jgi:hypothetical protein
MEINNNKLSKEVINKFHEIYNGDNDNLKKIPPVLLKMGQSYMEILMLTRAELGLGLGEAIMLLEIPDVII